MTVADGAQHDSAHALFSPPIPAQVDNMTPRILLIQPLVS